MKTAIIGSRNLRVENVGDYLPEGITEILSGGAKGVDTTAREYALENKIPFTEFLPEYHRYGRYAPLRRNLEIVSRADLVIAFWDGTSRGTKHVVDACKQRGVPVLVYLVDKNGSVRTV